MAYVIVIDDEEPVLELVRQMLASLGIEAAPAASGSQALRMIAERRPDLVVMDIVMPDIEGIELMRSIRRNSPGLPLVVMSGNSVGAKFLGSAKILGAKATLRKPFSLGELDVAVGTALGA